MKTRLVPPKRRGERAELHFAARASDLGLSVSKPYGDSDPYDFIVDSCGRLSRVQVKATGFRDARWRNGYTCPVTSPLGRAYSADEVDFLAAYVIPEDVWYIIPVAEITTTTVSLDPKNRNNKYRQYREAWDLLIREPLSVSRRERERKRALRIEASAEEWPTEAPLIVTEIMS